MKLRRSWGGTGPIVSQLTPSQRRVLAQLQELGGVWLRGACGSLLAGREQTLAALVERGHVVVAFAPITIDGHPFEVVDRVSITEKGRAAFPLRAPSVE